MNAALANPDVSSWDTSQVTTMAGLFWGADAANPDVSAWDTSNILSFKYFFATQRPAMPDTLQLEHIEGRHDGIHV